MQLFDKNGNLKNLQEYNLSTIEDKGSGVTYIVGVANLNSTNDSDIQNYLLSLKSNKPIIFDVILNAGSQSRLHGFKYPNSNYVMATLENYFGLKKVFSCNGGTWKVRTI